ncbi:tyrosine phosphatase family protein [Allorhizobium sp. BGMRC 0089]|uniref:tyrosine phosphatase family protein n=1 Tax=Allorhizobium sonneratiae TaxID=2934936 RepID=UPI002033B3FA|nr:tyrosine phosphatase family protein [Allorhizobium sonneratiae]MCM2291992.1 tyrosine phosphatase family protein [Allorhizobium sonneratiae]
MSGVIVVSPLARIAEMAVRHKAREMVSLMAERQDFHRPAVISSDRHLTLTMNDISFRGTGDLIAPQEAHVTALIDFVRGWDQSAPLLIHCWMGVSRSPAAALIACLALHPDQEDDALADRLRQASPFATPNRMLIEIADHLLERQGRLIKAVARLGRGADADGNAPFVLPVSLAVQG